MNRENLNQLLHQALETEKGGVLVYETALRCAVNEELKEEWTKYHRETRTHVEILEGVLSAFGLDLEEMTPGREVIKLKGEALVAAMEKALDAGELSAAELVAAECVVDAEMKDHLNWELLGEAVKELEGEEAAILKEACGKVEDEEDRHLYHTMGWGRELWLENLGLPAVLPPPEEARHVETAIDAAKAKQQRGRMLRKSRPAGSRRGRKGAKAE
jgi:hypothetical protein